MKTAIKKISRYLLMGVIVAGCAYVLWPGFKRYYAHREQVKQLESEIAKLEIERAELEKQMQALERQDPEHIERLARERLHLTKPGETIFRFKGDQ
ncbi:MAG: septum formation initiator family protein [Candidatus Abyssobacteria bacterium SURF_17]|uniref:Septum formation initiator family protein n=1 Tax=Candidatus Abyssobacteria bacterium SURF_17 TaxID=2093361 RepID=A0A419EUG0_9BACT|nr:MAG: septum formation initiator family protein [Candidatus Abyssubacteria bacterium SURF_17]